MPLSQSPDAPSGPGRAGAANALTLENELAWFEQVLNSRIRLYFEQDDAQGDIEDIPPPEPAKEDVSPYAGLIRAHNMNMAERLVLLLALIPHIRPQLLDIFYTDNRNFNRPFTEFGGWKGQFHSGFLPTGETAAFLVAGNNLAKRFQLIQVFGEDHFFALENILGLESKSGSEPLFSGQLVISAEYLNMLTTGISHKPDYNIRFPAKRITTLLTWDDLILAPEVHEDLEHIIGWTLHSPTIMDGWALNRVIKPGYRGLFHGPPGTGKTLTATLIGKRTQKDVYRIDLSMVVSKYIGETEKNLANVFDQAQKKDWILFFDEADALFGRRTQTSNSNDRHANQEIAYLLQRVEDYPGVVILATNLKSNIDTAFSRRFQSVVYFPVPDPELRLLLWQNTLGQRFPEQHRPFLEKTAEKYELSGGAITNVVRFGAIQALQNGQSHISPEDLTIGIQKELTKEGKTL